MLTAPSVEATGIRILGLFAVWTGSNVDGHAASGNCVDWVNAGAQGVAGDVREIDSSMQIVLLVHSLCRVAI